MSKKRVMTENMPSPQLKDIQFSTLSNNENIQDFGDIRTTPKHHSITSSQGSQGLRRSVGLLNLSIETSPNPDASSSPKLLLRKKKLSMNDYEDSNYINDVENWSPFKEPSTPTSKSKNQLKRPASNSSSSMSPFINDSQKPLLFSTTKQNIRSEQNRTNIQMKFNKLRKMVSLEKMSYDVESPFDNELHPLPNPSIHFQQPKQSSPNNSPSRPAKQRPKVEKPLTKNLLNNLKNGDTSMDGDFLTPNSYKFVKPLQTAFMSSGLLSKKNRKFNESINPPETPCKKPIQPGLASAQKQSFPSSNLANVITASSPMVKDNSTPNINDDDYDFPNADTTQETPSANNTTTTTLPRSARALNTNELRDCILKFTNDFDESADSIFDDDEQEQINKFKLTHDGPATPTRLKFAKDIALAKSLKLNIQPPTPGNFQSGPKTPIDVSIDLSGDSSNNSFAVANGTGLSPYISVPTAESNSNVDDHLTSQFQNVQLVGKGQFSSVYEITFQSNKYAVKRIKTPFLGSKSRKRIFEEVELLKILQENQPKDDEGKEYVINFLNDWEHNDHLYIMTEFCENGSLDKFLIENGNLSKLDEWRIWKILVEIGLGLKYIHSCDILHLDLKPANIFITFEGSLKIGDFGLASKYPVQPGFEREGDREYIAPEIISRQKYEKPADVFSFGLIMVEIAANIILPDNGIPWQKLRSGDLSDAGKLSSTELNVNLYNDSITSKNSIFSSMFNNTANTGSSYSSNSDSSTKRLPPWTPKFLIDGKGSLDKLVQWMISPQPANRPTAADILNTLEAQFVEVRRKAGAVIFEGEYGPSPDTDEDTLMDSEIRKLNFSSTATLTIPSDIMDEGEW